MRTKLINTKRSLSKVLERIEVFQIWDAFAFWNICPYIMQYLWG